MPMPLTYKRASDEFRAFLNDVKERMNLESDNMAYTAVDAVFQVFRRRLTVQQAVDFANALPCVLTAIFVKDWDVTTPAATFADRAAMTAEAQRIRANHNLTPDNAIEATAWALRRHADTIGLARVLSGLPREAQDFWRVAEAS